MKIGVPAEIDALESRVAATPETVKKFIALGAEVAVQSGAGLRSRIPDAEYAAAGATIAAERRRRRCATPMSCSRFAGPIAAELPAYKPGALVVAIMDPYGHEERRRRHGRRRRHRLRHGVHAAHHPRAGRWTCCPARPTSPAIRR